MSNILHIVLVVLAVNFAAFAAFWRDKRLARSGARRIPEKTLLWLAFAGGSLGALSAQHLFRHKTRKEPFRSRLYAIVALHAVAVAVLALWLIAPQWASGLFNALKGPAVS
ncbi:DUF1294 domain-containing protein [Aminobacter sp. P9b]|uniref:Uncharacterized membrane protein YsdA (DUF1294 family) n=1 Tax=Aminobacter niigataensis TaxID=83265 RepID=A0ABR6L4A5_9HYPH|nr:MULTISPECIES: DUF1294 domain-containing protein [Aminobacter]AWC21586.1 hypothetical protein CO731_01038 [Aminobacter sp. MSH1]MBB4651641.1 uncharacterized membrane protein YsdA (DUF1294 family) [Aminobacter niigataensis]